MRVSQLIGSTLRESSSETELISHDLLVRAGYIRQLASGIFANLHLAQRSIDKIEGVIRQEMDAIGGVELTMPVVHPAELWERTGRYDAIDDSLVRFRDRTDRRLVLAMTHEEVVAWLAASGISSYKQLPKLIYQIQMKFRDELRSRGGLIRVREFRMKDSYSLDTTWEGLEKQYQAHYHAYFKIMQRLGLPVQAVLSDVGMMGGKKAHEFMYLTPIGEDTVFIDEENDYFANREIAVMQKPAPEAEEPKPLTEVATPDCRTIDELCQFLSIEAKQTAKVVFFVARKAGEEEGKLVIAVVRGDHEVNDIKLRNLLEAVEFRVAEEAEIRAAGCEPGYASPIGLAKEAAIIVADDYIPKLHNLVTGANKAGYHYTGANYGRDFEATIVADIVNAVDGGLSPEGGALKAHRAVEVGNIFQLGTKYSESLDANFMSEQGRPTPIIMGSYGIGIGRLLACLVEEYNDENGICLPPQVAPYQVQLVSLADNDEAISTAEQLYQDLTTMGVEVLYDDRTKKVASPGVKFKDADLRGMPFRITVSKKTITGDEVEWKPRASREMIKLKLEDIGEVVEAALADFLNL